MAFILDERADTRLTPIYRAPCSSNQTGDAASPVVESLTTALAALATAFVFHVRALIA
jgi:hypothetical protein